MKVRIICVEMSLSQAIFLAFITTKIVTLNNRLYVDSFFEKESIGWFGWIGWVRHVIWFGHVIWFFECNSSSCIILGLSMEALITTAMYEALVQPY